MFGSLRSRLRRVGDVAATSRFAASVLNKTGFLGALSPAGVMSFARQARELKLKPGPYMAFMLHAANKPEKTALVDGERRFDYASCDALINQLCHGLSELGVGPKDRVALMLPNCAEYIIAQNALARLGAAAVQIGYRLKGPEVAYILENSDARVVLYDAVFESVIGQARELAGGPDESRLVCVGAGASADDYSGVRWEELVADQSETPPPLQGTDSSSSIVYTSGTTGKPKGASRSYQKTGLGPVADMMRRVGMQHDDRHLAVCPLYHSAAPAFIAMTYALGATVVVLDRFDAEKVLACIERERITSAFMVPTMLGRLAAVPPEVRRKYDLSSLRWVMSGAAPLPTETARRFQEAFGPLLWNFYGATETGLVTLAGPGDHVSRPGTIGTLLRGNEVRILDDDGEQLPTGSVGELYVRNDMLIVGYHKNDDATRASMRDGFFSVGDLGRIDHDGYVFLESRKHDMVISGGVNIYPREIEDVLHNHPAIADAAVVGVPDPEWGESLAAFIVLRQPQSLSENEVVEFCRDALADYKRPRRVHFLDELPRNPTGKVLKTELRTYTG